MSRLIDKRPNGRHKSAVNRQRFMRRFKKQIQEAVRQAISGRSIKKVEDTGEKITLPAKDISEPSFKYAPGGIRNILLPGNKNFIPGDLIRRPPQGAHASGDGRASDSPETGADPFVFEISKNEFLEIFFEDLALPNLLKTQIAKIPSVRTIRSGFTSEGVPTNIHIPRTLKGALSRRLALTGETKKELEHLEKERDALLQHEPNASRLAELDKQIRHLYDKIRAIPFIDPFDLRYHRRVTQVMPTTQAVMFCLMDVSGSMDEAKKDVAKRFFILLYLFLNKTYENVDIVFIRHHTSAKEVMEEEFFYSRETGGTVVSSALELMKHIMTKRYPASEWNIYAAQASDGDNWNNDSPRCQEILQNDLLPYVQYFAYVEIMPRHHQSLWEAYLHLIPQFPQFAMQNIEDQKDIYPVFRSLFKKKHHEKK